MKKLALALILSAAASTAQAEIGTGFYLGGAAGTSSTTSKGTVSDPASGDLKLNNNYGRTTSNVGLYGGYGVVTGCTYFGGELGYTYSNQKLEGKAAIGTLINSFNFNRKHILNFALRAGYKYSPGTMGYVRLGLNTGKQKLTATDFTSTPSISRTASKRATTFVPGVGIETALHRNLWLRAEFTHDLGKKIKVTAGNATVNLSKVKSNDFKLGLTYIF